MHVCVLTFRSVVLAVFLSPTVGVQISTVQQGAFSIIAACTAGRDQFRNQKQVLLRHKASREGPSTWMQTHILVAHDTKYKYTFSILTNKTSMIFLETFPFFSITVY